MILEAQRTIPPISLPCSNFWRPRTCHLDMGDWRCCLSNQQRTISKRWGSYHWRWARNIRFWHARVWQATRRCSSPREWSTRSWWRRRRTFFCGILMLGEHKTADTSGFPGESPRTDSIRQRRCSPTYSRARQRRRCRCNLLRNRHWRTLAPNWLCGSRVDRVRSQRYEKQPYSVTVYKMDQIPLLAGFRVWILCLNSHL